MVTVREETLGQKEMQGYQGQGTGSPPGSPVCTQECAVSCNKKIVPTVFASHTPILISRNVQTHTI